MDLIVKELFNDTSSSSSEDEIIQPIQMISEILCHRQKNENYVENIVNLYTERDFIEQFKVPREVIIKLSEEFEASDLYPKKDTGYLRVSSQKCLLIFCWYATHEAAAFRDVADRFNIALSTLHLIIENVGLFLSHKSSDVIQWPSENEKRQIVEDFKQLGFPNTLGCLDGTHVRIDKPEVDPESYINRKKFYSVQFQAVCDSRKRIRDIFIGYPGSVHDARVFKNSPLHHTLSEKCGENLIIADSAYPCLRNLLTPYKDNPNNTYVQINFNNHLSRCRIKIEHTFGMLKQRFRSLYHLKLRKMTSICHFIRACCVLHNLTLTAHDDIEEEEILYIQDIVDDLPVEGNAAGQIYRDYMAARLFE